MGSFCVTLFIPPLCKFLEFIFVRASTILYFATLTKQPPKLTRSYTMSYRKYLPIDVIYQVVTFNPLPFIAASKRCHAICKNSHLFLPYHYRTNMCGFTCHGTGNGLVLRHCVLTGFYTQCHFTQCYILHAFIQPGTYRDCTFRKCTIHNTSVLLDGGTLNRCLIYFNVVGIKNKGHLTIDNCHFKWNKVAVFTRKGASTKIRKCTSLYNDQFAVTAGEIVFANETI